MEDLIKRPVYWFKRKYRQIQRVIDFFPLIWNGFDFDYRYGIDLFKKQLERTANELESDRAVTLSAKVNAQKIRTAIRLMTKVYDEEYSSEYHNWIEQLYGETNFEFVETGELDSKGEPYYTLELRNAGAVDDEHQKEIDKLRHHLMLQCRDKEAKAHRILWKFIEHNIRNWWD